MKPPKPNKRRNRAAQDATLINIRALKSGMRALSRRVFALEERWIKLMQAAEKHASDKVEHIIAIKAIQPKKRGKKR